MQSSALGRFVDMPEIREPGDLPHYSVFCISGGVSRKKVLKHTSVLFSFYPPFSTLNIVWWRIAAVFECDLPDAGYFGG